MCLAFRLSFYLYAHPVLLSAWWYMSYQVVKPSAMCYWCSLYFVSSPFIRPSLCSWFQFSVFSCFLFVPGFLFRGFCLLVFGFPSRVCGPGWFANQCEMFELGPLVFRWLIISVLHMSCYQPSLWRKLSAFSSLIQENFSPTNHKTIVLLQVYTFWLSSSNSLFPPHPHLW